MERLFRTDQKNDAARSLLAKISSKYLSRRLKVLVVGIRAEASQFHAVKGKWP
jgi:hypothetical protein